MTLRVVAIDGVLGAGKTTIAQRLAAALGLEYLDTGAMYRAVAVACLRRGVDLDDAGAVAHVAASVSIDVSSRADGTTTVRLDGDDVSGDIRKPDVSLAASRVATNAEVRAHLVAQQRQWAQRRGGGVLEGRDISTVVFPDAPVKIFLTASVEERARRRHAEQPERSYEDVVADLEWRDRNDSTRAADPLRVAAGATVVDTTGWTLDEVTARAVAVARDGLALHDDDAAAVPATPAAPAVRNTPDPSAPGVPQPMLQRIVFRTVRDLVVGFVRLYFRVRIDGLENVPSSGAYLVSPVHRSNVDSVVVPAITRRRMRFVGKDSMWKIAWIGRVFDVLGGIKVVRGTTDRESMRLCLAALDNGEPVVVYPEGRRKSGPLVEDLFDGAAYMAVKAGVPILPIGIGGSDKAMAVEHRFPRPKPIHVVVGAPMSVPSGLSPASSRKAMRALTVDLQAEIQRLYDLAQERVGRR